MFTQVKTERFLEIDVQDFSKWISEKAPIVVSILKKGNGIPSKAYVIKAEITGDHIISFRGTNRGWIEGSCDTR
jgi:hypothetical protein